MIPTPILVGKTVQIARDPFARYDTVRRTIHYGPDRDTTCAWCGQRGRVNVNGFARLFQYGTHTDGLLTRAEFDDHVFCSIDCCRTYHT